jgi:hypothetical protein
MTEGTGKPQRFRAWCALRKRDWSERKARARANLKNREITGRPRRLRGGARDGLDSQHARCARLGTERRGAVKGQ